MLVATTVRLLPEVVDPSIVVTGSGLGGLLAALFAAAHALPQDRLGRVVLAGNLVGGLFGALIFVLALVAQVLS